MPLLYRKEAFCMDSLTDFFHTLDGLYADGRHDEIEDFLRRTLAQHRICCGGHDAVFTAALNELGTYYRGAGRYDESVQAFEEAGRDILSYGQKDTARKIRPITQRTASTWPGLCACSINMTGR